VWASGDVAAAAEVDAKAFEQERTHFRATVAYDGTDFLGFQWQAQGRTVQGVLEGAVRRITGQDVRVVGSGRTDSGVHARGQVIGFRVEWRHAPVDLQRAMNAVLPDDVGVLELGAAEAGWHPRFSARRRCYRYTVLNRPGPAPLERRYAWALGEALDLEALQAGAGLLVGEHDFGGFGQPTQGDNTVRRVFECGWSRCGRLLTLDVVGNAFLRGMVRRIVGTLIPVGMGQWPVERISRMLAEPDRALAGPPAPACGLCLMGVEYE
jgi:tRNA pseudouridine38-40 synthase